MRTFSLTFYIVLALSFWYFHFPAFERFDSMVYADDGIFRPL